MAARVALSAYLGALAATAWAHPQLIPPAYQWAAQAAGVPASVLWAIALQESGLRLHGKLVPWPWTLNIAGVASRYPNRTSACAALLGALQWTRPTHIDAGLGQLNVGYYGERVRHPCELLDPYANLTLAATTLQGHHRPGEDWVIAAGRYHHPAGGAVAKQYQQRVEVYLSRASLTVVEDFGGTSALPYYRALNLQTAAPQDRASPQLPIPTSPSAADREANLLPVHSALLSPGTVVRRVIEAPGLSPIFLLGDDLRSHAWLQQHFQTLRSLHATGIVVQVESTQALTALRQLAQGLPLEPASGDDIARRLHIDHYPVLITATGLEQ